LREGKKLKDTTIEAVEVEYAMFQVAVRVARERLRGAAEELGTVGILADISTSSGNSELSDPLELSSDSIVDDTDSDTDTLPDTTEEAGSTTNRTPSRQRPSGRMAIRGGHTSASRGNGSRVIIQTHRSMLTPSAAGRGQGRGVPERSLTTKTPSETGRIEDPHRS
jgi:hypothetical protein